MNKDIKHVVISGEDGRPTIQLEWVKNELYPYHLEIGVGEYNIVVRSDGENREKIVVVELMHDNRQIVVEDKTNKEIGVLNLRDGVKYGIYIGGKDISHRKQPDGVIEGTARYGICHCITVCGGPCPGGYYYQGPCGTCSYSLTLMCCCRVP